jgi:hypothetical protein
MWRRMHIEVTDLSPGVGLYENAPLKALEMNAPLDCVPIKIASRLSDLVARLHPPHAHL